MLIKWLACLAMFLLLARPALAQSRTIAITFDDLPLGVLRLRSWIALAIQPLRSG